MHNWIMSIGSAVINHYYQVSATLLESLKIAGIGMLGIFLVIGIIVLAVSLLNKAFSRD